MFKRFILPLCLTMATALACAQTSGQSEVAMPEIQENPPGQETGVMGGGKPFSLTTAVDGELSYNFGEGNELESLTAKKGVVFTSEDMTLNADQMDYKTATQELIATGRKVVVRQGEMIATCQLFKYNPDNQKSELSGNPIVYNKTKDGKVSTTVGEKITIATVNGKPTMKVHGMGTRAPGLNSGGPSVPVPSTAGNAKLILNENGVAPSIGAPAPKAAESGAAGVAPSMPSFGGDTEKEPAVKPSNRINVNDPAELKSFSKQ